MHDGEGNSVNREALWLAAGLAIALALMLIAILNLGAEDAQLASPAHAPVTDSPQSRRPHPLDVARWFTPEDYPPAAIRAGESGRVGALLEVDRVGQVTSCRIAESSGSVALDTATCTVARREGRFAPARDREGRAVAGSYTVAIRWELPEPR